MLVPQPGPGPENASHVQLNLVPSGLNGLPDNAGGAMFVGCVVAGSVIMANGGVPARGALMRDTASVIIAVSFIGLVLASGLVRTRSLPA